MPHLYWREDTLQKSHSAVQNVTAQNATVQKDTVQNGRSAEMGNVPIVLSSRVTEWLDVATRNNKLHKQLKDIMKIQYYFDQIYEYNTN